MKEGSTFLDRWVARPFQTSIPVALLALLALPIVFRARIDNGLEVWLDRGGEAHQEYQSFKRRFGNEEFLLVVYPCPERVDLPFLERLTDLRFELEDIEGVRRVTDLARIYSKLFATRGIEAYRDHLASSPFLSGFLVSADQRLAASWVHLESAKTVDRTRLVAEVEQAIQTLPEDGIPSPAQIHLAGSPVLNVALDRSSRAAARTFFPLVFLLSAALLFVFHRRLADVIIPFISVGTGILWTLAALVLAGSTLNMVTVALPPLVWVLGLSTSIHLLSCRREALSQGHSPEAATRVALRTLFRPCLYSALTTALGFASLLASSMRPVQEMGAFTALGILFCFASNFLLFPSLMLLNRRFKSRPAAGREDHPLLDLLVLGSRRPKRLLAVTVLVSLVFALGISRLETESNPIAFFRDDAPIAVTYREVLPGFTGPYSLEVTLEPPPGAEEGLARQRLGNEVLRQLDVLRVFAESDAGVARALSVVDLIKQAHQQVSGHYRLPETEAELADAWDQLERHSQTELDTFFASGVVRMTLLAQPMGSRAHRDLTEGLQRHLDATIAPSWRPRLTGLVPLLVDMQDRLVESQVKTFALTFVVVMLVLGALLRDFRDVLLSLPSNLLPIAFALGTMGWLGIPLDPATVMIAGIALGIAVDDTIHFLIGYRRRRQLGHSPGEAAEETIHFVGRPMVITSLVAALGFLVLCFSDFVPLLHFGLLTAVTMLAALIGDLVVLPALLLMTAGSDGARHHR